MYKAILVLHVAIFLAGFTGVFGRLISLDAYMLVFMRMSFAFVFLCLFMYFFSPLKKLPKHAIFSAFVTGSILMLHLFLFYASIKLSNVSIGVITLSCTGFFAAILEPLFFKKKIAVVELCISLLTILGISLVFHLDTKYRLGIIVGIASASAASCYFVGAKYVTKGYDLTSILFWQLVGGIAFLSLFLPAYFYVFGTKYLHITLIEWGYLLVLASACTCLLFLLELYAVKRVSAFTTALSSNLEPVYSIILAMIIFNEASELSAAFFIGLSLICLSVILQSIIQNKKESLSEKQKI